MSRSGDFEDEVNSTALYQAHEATKSIAGQLASLADKVHQTERRLETVEETQLTSAAVLAAVAKFAAKKEPRPAEHPARTLEQRFDSLPVLAEKGEKGERGPQGAKGDPGEPGPVGPAPDHEWVNSRLRFKKPDGKWGKLVDLAGKDGKNGKDGRDGAVVVIRGGGSTGVDLSALPGGQPSIEPAGIPVMQGGRLVSLPWSAFVSVMAGALDVGSDMTRREDFVGETTLYRGEAAPGASETAPVWKIKRIQFTPNADVITKFAAGTADYVHAWSDRVSLEYQ